MATKRNSLVSKTLKTVWNAHWELRRFHPGDFFFLQAVPDPDEPALPQPHPRHSAISRCRHPQTPSPAAVAGHELCWSPCTDRELCRPPWSRDASSIVLAGRELRRSPRSRAASSVAVAGYKLRRTPCAGRELRHTPRSPTSGVRELRRAPWSRGASSVAVVNRELRRVPHAGHELRRLPCAPPPAAVACCELHRSRGPRAPPPSARSRPCRRLPCLPRPARGCPRSSRVATATPPMELASAPSSSLFALTCTWLEAREHRGGACGTAAFCVLTKLAATQSHGKPTAAMPNTWGRKSETGVGPKNS